MDNKDKGFMAALILIGVGFLINGIAILKNIDAVLTGLSLDILKWTATVEGVVAMTAGTGIAVKKLSDNLESAKFDFNKRMDTLSKAFSKTVVNTAAEVLSLITGLLTYFIQEALFPESSSKMEKIFLSIALSILLFLSSFLISQEKKLTKVLGILFFVSPIPVYMYIAGISIDDAINFIRALSSKDRLLALAAIFVLVLIIPFSLIRNRKTF